MKYDVLAQLFASKNSPREILNLESRSVSYKEFCSEVSLKSNRLQQCKVSSLAILCEDYFEVFTWVFACWQSGGQSILLNPSMSSEAKEHCIGKSNPDAVVEGSEMTVLKSDPLPVLPELVIFTSGSTGPPKGVLQQMSQVSMNASLVCDRIGLIDQDRLFINTPAYFTSGLIHFLTQIYAGGSLIARAGFFFGADLIKMVEETRATGFGGAPIHFSKFFDDTDCSFPECLKFIVSSGDHLPVHLIESARTAAPELKIFTMYGLTEVAGRLCVLDPEFITEKQGSVGHPLSQMSVSILDEHCADVAPGELGRVFVNGPMLMQGYLGELEKSEEVLTNHGFSTGDMGFIDSDGFLWLRGRQDGVFKSGAEKVSSLVIEEQLMATGFFKDVAIIAKADALLGHVPICFYVIKEGENFKRSTVNKQLKKRLLASHIPRGWHSVELIPRTASGKIRKNEIIEKMAM